MLANYGFKDGTGEFFITIDSDKCNACGDCVPACPEGVLAVGEDVNDPMRDEQVAFVVERQRRKIKFTCNVCKPSSGYDIAGLPCVKACPTSAIVHSW